MGTMSCITLQDEIRVDEFFNFVTTEILALFEHFEFQFLREFRPIDELLPLDPRCLAARYKE